MEKMIAKRVFDIFFSIAGLIFLLPLLLIVSILIKLDSKGSVFFIQKRVGKNFRSFNLYKFRTMVNDNRQNNLFITSNIDPRITRVGKILRKTKIDELPQLWNVIKGDMSIVGPRPEVEKYVEIFRRDYKEILKIKPGITDYAAIEFRNEEGILRKYDSIEDGYIKEILPAKIKLYKKYLKEKNFFLDIKIILLTLWKIVKS